MIMALLRRLSSSAIMLLLLSIFCTLLLVAVEQKLLRHLSSVSCVLRLLPVKPSDTQLSSCHSVSVLLTSREEWIEWLMGGIVESMWRIGEETGNA